MFGHKKKGLTPATAYKLMIASVCFDDEVRPDPTGQGRLLHWLIHGEERVYRTPNIDKFNVDDGRPTSEEHRQSCLASLDRNLRCIVHVVPREQLVELRDFIATCELVILESAPLPL
jgi:hypothetical protein